MNSSIYTRLAFTNLKNNRKTYIPYILTAVLTVMMYFIMETLYKTVNFDKNSLETCLGMAAQTMSIFALIFLFYTNSFLIKRRKKEIGVYNILGMGKRHIAKMLCVETLATTVVSIGGGLVGGLVFGKLMHLLLLKILHHDTRISYAISGAAMGRTVILFLVIFGLTLCYNLLQIRHANAVELLRGGNVGEREPKTRKILALLGVILLGIGYGIAVKVEEPLQALSSFFVAVVCVILGTYALFVAGSIAFLKLLKKKKNYYYKTKHFTSVSGMLYRMKQNAVGLANICILSTMVLVTVSSTVSLYVGIEDILRTRFPREVRAEVLADPEAESQLHAIIDEGLAKYGARAEGELAYHIGDLAAVKTGSEFRLTEENDYGADYMCEVYLLTVDEYNQMEGEAESLAADEALIYSPEEAYGKETFTIGGQTFRVKKEVDNLKVEPKNKSGLVDSYYMIFQEQDQMEEILAYVRENSSMDKAFLQEAAQIRYEVCFDMAGKKEDGVKAAEYMMERVSQAELPGSDLESRELGRSSFYILYGAILFIGIYLGAMFLMATVLIIYYKQISEGYDDRERYQIMQKVGMSKREVKRTIRSQVITVFFLPLVMAFIHITVAFNVITKLLRVLQLTNVPLFATCTVITGIVFAVFYMIVFAATAKEYYRIVQ